MERLLTVAEVVDRWRVSRGTVYDLIARGEVRHYRISTRVRIPESAVAEYEASRLKGAA